jgi:hypothetical protein
VAAIKHWSAEVRNYDELYNANATWFIDPPYVQLQKHYKSSAKNPIDFDHLAVWCKSRNGQTIVCEQEGATWLPFLYLGRASAARSTKKCCEVIWSNLPLQQTALFGDT